MEKRKELNLADLSLSVGEAKTKCIFGIRNGEKRINLRVKRRFFVLRLYALCVVQRNILSV